MASVLCSTSRAMGSRSGAVSARCPGVRLSVLRTTWGGLPMVGEAGARGLQRPVTVATDPSARLDLRIFGHRLLELPLEQPHRAENLAEAGRCSRPVGLPEGEDAVVAQ